MSLYIRMLRTYVMGMLYEYMCHYGGRRSISYTFEHTYAKGYVICIGHRESNVPFCVEYGFDTSRVSMTLKNLEYDGLEGAGILYINTLLIT